MVITF